MTFSGWPVSGATGIAALIGLLSVAIEAVAIAADVATVVFVSGEAAAVLAGIAAEAPAAAEMFMFCSDSGIAPAAATFSDLAVMSALAPLRTWSSIRR